MVRQNDEHTIRQIWLLLKDPSTLWNFHLLLQSSNIMVRIKRRFRRSIWNSITVDGMLRFLILLNEGVVRWTGARGGESPLKEKSQVENILITCYKVLKQFTALHVNGFIHRIVTWIGIGILTTNVWFTWCYYFFSLEMSI